MLNTKYIVREIDTNNGSKHLRKFEITVTGYQACVSASSFFFNKKQRNWYNGILYHARLLYDERIYQKALEKYTIHLEEPETQTVDSIWDFYKLINYDYKKQKYN